MSDNPEQKNPENPPVTPPPKWYMDEGIKVQVKDHLGYMKSLRVLLI